MVLMVYPWLFKPSFMAIVHNISAGQWKCSDDSGLVLIVHVAVQVVFPVALLHQN